jgi:hypothetical protein
VGRSFADDSRARVLIVANLFFFFALLPFISPAPGPSDIQLPAFLIALVIIATDVWRGKWRLSAAEYAFLAIAIWSMCFVLPSGTFTLRERGGLLAAFMIYYVVKKYGGRFLSQTLYLAIVLNFAATLFQLFRPDLYGQWAPLAIRTVKLIQGGRGLSGLAPEPSALATVALTHGLLAFYFRRYVGMPSAQFWTALAMSVAVVFLSRSATGFVFLFLIAAVAIGYLAFAGMSATRWALLGLSGGLMIALLVGPLAKSRGGSMVVALMRNPKEVMADGSLQERVRCLTIGMLSLVHYPFGAGGGSFPDVALEMQRRYPVDRVFDVANPTGVVGVLNAGGLYLVEMGVVYLFFVGIILAASFRVEVIHLMMMWLAFMFLVIAGSAASPLTWLLLGLTARTHRRTRFSPGVHGYRVPSYA